MRHRDPSFGTMALVENFQPMPEGTAEPLMLTSPTLGFGAGQTARLSVVNTTTASETDTFSIVNGLGVTIKTATLTIGPGQYRIYPNDDAKFPARGPWHDRH